MTDNNQDDNMELDITPSPNDGVVPDMPAWMMSAPVPTDEQYAEEISRAAADDQDEDDRLISEWQELQTVAAAAPKQSIGEMLLAARKQLLKKPERLHEYLEGHPLGQFFADVSKAKQIPTDSVTVIGMGSVSAACALTYRVITPWGEGSMPLGLYTIAEQPPSCLKSGTLEAFTKPLRAAITEVNKSRRRAIRDAEEALESVKVLKDKDMIAEKKEELGKLHKPIVAFVADATPEALDSKVVTPNKGYFNISSAEQTAVETLFGLMYGDKKSNGGGNKEIPLKGYSGEYINTQRVGRDGFDGQVFGAITVFAQMETVNKVLGVSGGTGLAERFLMISEDSWLGFRKFDKDFKADDRLYNRMIANMMRHLPANGGFENLNTLELSAEGIEEIFRFKDEIEPSLGDAGRFSNDVMRGFAGKADTIAVKVAAILHLTSHYAMYEDRAPRIIRPEWVAMGIAFARETIERYLRMLVDKNVIGQSAEFLSVIEYLDERKVPVSLLLAKNSIRSRKPFNGAMKQVSKTLEEMKEQGVITITGEGSARKLALVQGGSSR